MQNINILKFSPLLIYLFLGKSIIYSQSINNIPSSHHNLYFDYGQKENYFKINNNYFYPRAKDSKYTTKDLNIYSSEKNKEIIFSFKDTTFSGSLFFGFMSNDCKISYPIYFKNSFKFLKGSVRLDLSKIISSEYDISNWINSGDGNFGYRIIDSKGNFIIDGRTSIHGTTSFKIKTSIIEGPFISCVSSDSVVISFKTNKAVISSIKINDQLYSEKDSSFNHEFIFRDLSPNKEYEYIIYADKIVESYYFKTAPSSGSSSPFIFAYTSDSRNGAGGGERNIFGVNAYILKKNMALAKYKNSAFFQFTGDLIDGYVEDRNEALLQYNNWKYAVTPFASQLPIYVGMGNHENIQLNFTGDSGKIFIDKYPYDSESSEAVFAQSFVNPNNGPISEDGSKYDINTKKRDFPSYKENVYYYTYSNTAVVVLNSDYWYSSSTENIPYTGGNPHGYIMDNQLEWLKNVINMLNNNSDIEHIFVTIHTPAFPNGGHSTDDMWYKGNNNIRPFISGKGVEKGIIERRDEFLDIIVNKSNKVVALLCGDEHNYSRTKISENSERYPKDYPFKKLILSRSIWQITNGTCGAPYYSQEVMPWSPSVEYFTSNYALTLFHINGKKVVIEVINPDTLEKLEELDLN